MESSSRNKIIFIVVLSIIVVVIVAAVIVVMNRGNNPSQTTGSGGQSGGTASSSSGGSSSTASPTRLPAPANVVVPEAGATSTGGVAVPQVESASAPGADSKYRSFDITIQNGQFTPSTIAVNLGDTVNLRISAVGGSYDFTQPDYGLKVSLSSGGSQQIEFAATAPGKFVFYCASCGGPAKGPTGYIVVK